MTSLRALARLPGSGSGDIDVENHLNSRGIPKDVRTILKTLDLAPQADHFVCCPLCFSLYPINERNQFQERCTYRPVVSGAACNAELCTSRKVKGQHKQFPCRKFVRQDFGHWLGRLLCRPGMETILDEPIRQSASFCHGPACDIWDAPVLHTIKLPDGRPFLDCDTNEGRYVFSICIDGFNPRGKGGPPVSVGSIFFVCLNLPPHLRYRPENMYLAGVIPGPKHPSKEQINNILDVILEPFLHAYKDGIFFKRTPSHPHGRRSSVIVIPLVADTLAAHQMNGNAPHNHTHFCPFCLLLLSDMENLDYTNWPRRTCQEHIAIARDWLYAESEENRAHIYQAEGIRWSSFLTLPYWDPIHHMAIDPMHNLYLGVLKHHCENVWGMSSEIDDGLEGITNDPAKRKPTAKEMADAHHAVREESLGTLAKFRVDVLRQLAKELGVPRWKSQKSKVLKRLSDLVRLLRSRCPIY